MTVLEAIAVIINGSDDAKAWRVILGAAETGNHIARRFIRQYDKNNGEFD